MVEQKIWDGEKFKSHQLMTKEDFIGISQENLLNISEAARLIGVSENTLREWDQNGKLPASRTDGGHRRYELESIRRYTEHNTVVKKGSIEHEISTYRTISKSESELIYEKWNSEGWLDGMEKHHQLPLAVLMENSKLMYELTEYHPIALVDLLWLIREGWEESKLRHCITIQPLLGPTGLAYFKNKNNVIDSKVVLAATHALDFSLFPDVDFHEMKNGYVKALAKCFDNFIFEILYKKWGVDAETIGTLNRSYDFAIVPEQLISTIPKNHFSKIIGTHNTVDEKTFKLRAVAGDYPLLDKQFNIRTFDLPIFMPYLINLGSSATGFTNLMYRGSSLI